MTEDNIRMEPLAGLCYDEAGNVPPGFSLMF